MICKASAVLLLLVVVADDVRGVVVDANEVAKVTPGCETSPEVNAAAAAQRCLSIAWVRVVL